MTEYLLVGLLVGFFVSYVISKRIYKKRIAEECVKQYLNGFDDGSKYKRG